MSAGWVAVVTALAYLCVLFAVAHFGDTQGRRYIGPRLRAFVYALTICVYCSSWAFFGSVGVASTHGFDFLPVYIGPLLVLGAGHPFILRILRLAKAQNITSIADFVAARYGKSQPVAALVAAIAVIGAIPYLSLQLKAITGSLTAILGFSEPGRTTLVAVGDTSLILALLLAAFAMAFGTRRIDTTEHQDGLMLAVAVESLVKLVAFIAVGIFVVWSMFSSPAALARRVRASADVMSMLNQIPDFGEWAVTILLSASCVLLLPRQFHVTFVENRDESATKTAAWLVPLYLVLINIFVIPIALGGRLTFPNGTIDRDMTMIALPLQAHSSFVALLAMIGGLSAATAMVVVESVALAIMVSNDLVMPLVLRGRNALQRRAPPPAADMQVQRGDLGTLVLNVRRIAIVAILFLGYVYFKWSSDAALASIGLLSFAAIAQIAPAFFGGLVWRRANARGAIAALIAGTIVWGYVLLMPSLAHMSDTIADMVARGPLGIRVLRPQALFGSHLPPLIHGVVWSLSVNILAFVGFSLARHPTPIERLQGELFVGSEPAPMGQVFRLWRSSVTVGELEATVARYLGADSTHRAFDAFRAMHGLESDAPAEADVQILRYAEHLLAAAIGTSSSRLVLSLLLRRRNISRDTALQLVDDASAMLKYNRDLLQHALDFARQGITVFDKDLRLICWNREFRDLFNLPIERLHVGTGLEDVVRFNAARGLYGRGTVDDLVASHLELLVNESEPFRIELQQGSVIEVRSARMPDGGIVMTYTDVTQTVSAEKALEATNETLEQRVRERTEELVDLNRELASAKAEADEANLSKTRFLAAASHDLLQPLNAARLYASSLVERIDGSQPGERAIAGLTHNLDASLEAVEDMLSALLEISQLDAGAMQPERSDFRIDDILGQLRIEFEPLAAGKRLAFIVVPSSLSVHSDRRLLSRLSQNLVSNAVKYTETGGVLVGCRRRADRVRIEVWDTGPGIPLSQQTEIFREFTRLAPAVKSAPGAGLGLSIVERLSRVLGHNVSLRSRPGRGSVFAVELPLSEAAAAYRSGVASTAAAYRPLAGMKALVIDNEASILEGMRLLLEGWGCCIETSASWEEAANILSSFAPDVIIADYHLDAGDGLSVIGAARAILGTDLAAILITADRGPAVRGRAAELAISVLTKPLKPAALRSLLSQWHLTRRAAE